MSRQLLETFEFHALFDMNSFFAMEMFVLRAFGKARIIVVRCKRANNEQWSNQKLLTILVI